MFLVDEFYCDDGFGRVGGHGFADGCVCALADGFADEAEGKVRGERSDLALCGCELVVLWGISRCSLCVSLLRSDARMR